MRTTVLYNILCAWSLAGCTTAIVYGERPTAVSPTTTTTTTTGYTWGGQWSKPTKRPQNYVIDSNKPKPGTTYALLAEHQEGCRLKHAANTFKMDEIEPDLEETRTAIKYCASVCSSGKGDPTVTNYKTNCDFVFVMLANLEGGPRWICSLDYAPYSYDPEDIICDEESEDAGHSWAFKNDRMP